MPTHGVADKPPAADCTAGIDLSLVRDDVAFRMQRRIGLIPRQGLGILRRALFFAGITWIPLVIWAISAGQMWGVRPDDSFLGHFGVHVRCLVAIPLFVIAEGLAQKSVPPLLGYFVESGLVSRADVPQFRALIEGVARTKDRVLPWIIIFGVAIAWATIGVVLHNFEDMSWAVSGNRSAAEITFAGWWFALVVRPVFMAFLLAWIWRGVLVFILFLRLANFPLALVPTHPDRVGGLSFVDRFALVFSPVVFAVSAVAGASFAHDIIYHGVDVNDIKGELIATVVLVSVLFLAPFLPLAKPLGKLKRSAIMEYGSIVARHGKLVHRRWVLGEDIGEPKILDAPELGPVADIHAVFESVRNMRRLPVGKVALASIVLPAAVPMILVFAMQVPLHALLVKVLKTLV